MKQKNMVWAHEFWENWLRTKPLDKRINRYEHPHFLAIYNEEKNDVGSNSARYLRGKNADEVIEEVKKFFVSKGKSFSVTIFGHDQNATKLLEILEVEDYKKMGVYWRMIAAIDSLHHVTAKSGYLMREISWDELLMEDILQISLTNFPHYFNDIESVRQMVENSRQRYENNNLVDIINFVSMTQDGKPVGTSSVMYYSELPNIAELSGASVLPEYRNKGIYTDMLVHRARHARDRKCSYLHIAADQETSGPIVKRLGFEVVETMYDFRYDEGNQLPL